MNCQRQFLQCSRVSHDMWKTANATTIGLSKFQAKYAQKMEIAPMNLISKQSENCGQREFPGQGVKTLQVSLTMVFCATVCLSTMASIPPSHAKQKTASAETRADVLRRGKIECQRRFGKNSVLSYNGGWYIGESKKHWTINCTRPGSAEGRDTRFDIPLK
jgi:hypothetical protein